MRAPSNRFPGITLTAVALCCSWMLAFGAPIAFAQSTRNSAFIADAATGCRIWNPNPHPNETIRWSGACVNGLAQGKGRLQWLRGGAHYETDEGEWNAGRQFGHGTQQWPLGRYEGELVDSLPNGEGVLTMQNARYDGEFRDGKPNGVGTVTSQYGVFFGTWKDGCFVSDARKMGVGVSPSSCR